jgi:hypothetical protein
MVFVIGVVVGIVADRYVVPKVIEKYNELKDKYYPSKVE